MGEPEEMMSPHDKMMHHAMKELKDLTPDQHKKIEAIKAAAMPGIQAKFKEMAVAMESMGNMMANEPMATMEQAKAGHQKVQDIMNQIENMKFEMHYQIAAVLQHKQRMKIHDMMMKHHKKMMEHMQK